MVCKYLNNCIYGLMKLLLSIVLFIIVSVSSYGSAASNNDIYFYHIGIQDGLAQINVMSIYQDEMGTMWFGTTEGLNRYNGQTMQIFRPSEEIDRITQNMIYSIQGDKAGSIYIHADNNLIRYDIASQKFRILPVKNIKAVFSRKNSLWVVTGNEILQYDKRSDTFIKYAQITADIGNIKCFYINDKQSWVGGTKGLAIISGNTGEKQEHILKNEDVTCLFEDSRACMYIGTYSSGMYVISPSRDITNYKHSPGKNSISNNQVRTIIEDNTGAIWIGTFFGLNRYDPESGLWKKYISNDNIPYALSHNSVFALLKDIQGTVWVGTYFGGVNYFNTEIDMFRYYGASSTNIDFLSFPFVGKMTEDGKGNLWICTEGGALNCLNLESRQFSRFMFKNNNLETTEYNNQKCIWYRQGTEQLYIGTYNGGLVIYDINKQNFRRILSGTANPYSLPNNTINKMQYYDGCLVLLTQSGFAKMDMEKEELHPLSTNPDIIRQLSGIGLYTFLIDSNDRLWIQKGGITSINLKTKEVRNFKQDQNGKDIISSNITDIYESSSGDIYFSTVGHGIFRYTQESDKIETYTKKDGLKSDYCYCISELPSGKLLLLHNKGISILSPEQISKPLLMTTPKFPLTGFNYGSSVYVTKNKEIFIGGVNGLVSFYEEDLNKKDNKYTLYFDKLYVNHQLVVPEDKSGILDKSLFLCDEIKLGSEQNNIIIEFASSNYLNTTHSYEYKLEGYDNEWIHTDNPVITYTNLNAGSYKLLIREEQDGEKSSQIYMLAIYISPPFYLSIYAYILYFILIVLITGAVFRFYSQRIKLKATQKEKIQIEALNQNKLRFFMNVSHEFRTPVTLISGQIELLLTQKDLTNKVIHKLLRIQKNTNHLLNLVTELLDFRKQEQGYNRLNLKQVELIAYMKSVFSIFQEYALKKRIKFTFQYSEPDIMIYIDPVQFQKAVYNLLSNAFKYTQEGGNIKLDIAIKGQQVYIKVIDNGIGIPQESLSKVFDRFYQVEYPASGITSGTGIGLALTKGIVLAHKGEIYVKSTLNEGSTFVIVLNLGISHFSKQELEQKDTSSQSFLPVMNDKIQLNDLTEDETEPDSPRPNPDAPSVLFVEDNEELLKILTEAFSIQYNVYTATDGKTGWDIILKHLPDIVVSDIMMPNMTGKELCYKIKNNIYTSHIPVVLLTAQDSEQQILDGLLFNADAYITKPFSMSILLSQCNNLLNNRNLLYKKFRNKEFVTDNNEAQITGDNDNLLLNKAIEIIKSNFENTEFDMNRLATELGLGRTKLYMVIKQETGLTPNEFTLNLKLKEAVRLLENRPQMNISDIAICLGFSSTKYFSKCFKTFYGINPQDWRRKKDKPEEN